MLDGPAKKPLQKCDIQPRPARLLLLSVCARLFSKVPETRVGRYPSGFRRVVEVPASNARSLALSG